MSYSPFSPSILSAELGATSPSLVLLFSSSLSLCQCHEKNILLYGHTECFDVLM